jgi:hypothetical protein
MPLNVDLLNAGSILVQGSPIVSLYETGSGLCSTVRTGIDSIVSGSCSVITGGYSNTILSTSCLSVIGGGRLNTTQTRCSTIGGGYDNVVGVIGTMSGWYAYSYTGSLNIGWTGPYSPSSASTINGNNVLLSFYFNGGLASIQIDSGGSGYQDNDVLVFNGNIFPGGALGTDNVVVTINTANRGAFGTVGGGRENTASGCYSTVSGGYENTASGYASTISGGYQNEAREYTSTVSGGYRNSAICDYSTISGGYENTTLGYGSTISGGYRNTTSSSYSFIGNGNYNTVLGAFSIINGGNSNTVDNDNSSILGGDNNIVTNVCAHVIGTGISSTADNTLHVNCLHFSSIPTSAVGLAPGTVWNDSGTLKIA